MDLAQFEAQRSTLPCQACGIVGLDFDRNTNNGGVRPVCPHCGSKTPLPGVQWLRQNSAESRKVRRPSGTPSADEVWEANGNVCAFCALTRDECREYSIGITVQHVVPVFMGGGNSPLVPFCARCQQSSTAEQEKQRRIRERHGSMWDIIQRIEKNHPELLE